MSGKIFYHINSHKIFFWLFILILCAQIFLWKKTENFHAAFDIVPPSPNKYLVEAISFGDREFIFRSLAMRLQNSGDVFAGFVSLKNYDYSRIYDWMMMLDGLNSTSHLVPSLAANYYAQTSKTEDVHYIVDYLEAHASKDIDANWWWMFQASYLAKDSLNDLSRALELAKKLAKNNSTKAPLWTKEMPAFISEKMGNGCLAFKTIQQLIDDAQSGKREVAAHEMDFLRYFIRDRLSKLKNQKFDPRKC
jgi:hypothetical protein